MRRAVYAEWTKLRTLQSTAWLAGAGAVVTVLVGALTAASVSTEHCPTVRQCAEDTVKLSLGGVRVGQAVIVVLAALAITGEYAHRTIRPALTAVPRRATVLAAKAIVVSGIAAAVGTAGVLGSLLAGRLLLPGRGFSAANGYPPISLGDGATLRAAGGSVLYLVVAALLALGAGTVIRDTAGTVTTVLVALYLAPVFGAFVTDPDWRSRLDRFAPMNAGLAIQATERLDRLPIGPWPGLGVFALYAAAAGLLGTLLFLARDQ